MYFQQILCLLDIHFSLWTKMLKVTLPLLTSVLTSNVCILYIIFFFNQAKSKQWPQLLGLALTV